MLALAQTANKTPECIHDLFFISVYASKRISGSNAA
jgi:hypothetical protein